MTLRISRRWMEYFRAGIMGRHPTSHLAGGHLPCTDPLPGLASPRHPSPSRVGRTPAGQLLTGLHLLGCSNLKYPNRNPLLPACLQLSSFPPPVSILCVPLSPTLCPRWKFIFLVRLLSYDLGRVKFASLAHYSIWITGYRGSVIRAPDSPTTPKASELPLVP